MSNMSYCRFENTLHDLRDCLDHIEDDDLSQSEATARAALVRACYEILYVIGVTVDEDEVNNYIAVLNGTDDS